MSTCNDEILESNYTDWPIVKTNADEGMSYVERRKGTYSYHQTINKITNSVEEEWKYKDQLHRVKGPALLRFYSHPNTLFDSNVEYFLFGHKVKPILHSTFCKITKKFDTLNKFFLCYCYLSMYTGFIFYSKKRKKFFNFLAFVYQANMFYSVIILTSLIKHTAALEWVKIFTDVVQLTVFIVNSYRMFSLMNKSLDQDEKFEHMNMIMEKIFKYNAR